MAIVHITDRAALEIKEIKQYSASRWGAHRAAQYAIDINKTLELIAEHPRVMRSKPEVSGRLGFYTSGEHILVFSQKNEDIYLMTVMHSKMEWIRRVGELEQTLMEEVEIMHARIMRGRES